MDKRGFGPIRVAGGEARPSSHQVGRQDRERGHRGLPVAKRKFRNRPDEGTPFARR